MRNQCSAPLSVYAMRIKLNTKTTMPRIRTLMFMPILLIAGCNSHNQKEKNTIAQSDSIYLYDTIRYVIPEFPFNEYDSVVGRRILISDRLKPRNWYQFHMNASVNGCGNVLLQKVSRDLQNELLIRLEFDKVPKFQWIDISKYSKSINIYFNIYDKDNKYVEAICNDYRLRSVKPMVKYVAVQGSLNIIYWSDKESVVSVMTRNLVVQDSSKNELHLPFEFFNQLKVHWFGG
jgi:hypothetical protein